MKKIVILLLIACFAVAGFAAQPKIALLINGTLGDKSFFDSAARGMEMVEEKLGLETKIVEMSYNASEWEPTIDDISDLGEYDIIIVGTWQMVEILARIAPLYPDTTYIIFDTDMDFSGGDIENVVAITYKQNEGSFLAGALAAMVSKSDKFPYSNPDKKLIGLLGGMDIPVINDFAVGYIEGAKYIDPEMKVSITYVGAWNDPAKGKEFTLAMYRQGADVVFAVAGETGNGVLEAAKAMDRYSIGVDSDMQVYYESKDMEIVNHMLTSMLKNVDQSLLTAVEYYVNGTLPVGTNMALGLEEGAVGLANNQYFEKLMNDYPEVAEVLANLEKDIIDGKIEITTAFGMTNEEFDAIQDSVRP